jgi:hypothetical protein
VRTLLILGILSLFLSSCEERQGSEPRSQQEEELARGTPLHRLIDRMMQGPAVNHNPCHNCHEEPTRSNGQGLRPLWHFNASGPQFTTMTYRQLDQHGQHLLQADRTPSDIQRYCPEYARFNAAQKRDFYVFFFSVIAKYESNFRPQLSYRENFKDSSGSNVISRGLLQVSRESVLGYGCRHSNAQQLHDPEKNLECGVRILNRWMGRDNYLGSRVNGRWVGGARYWSVLRETHPRHSQLVNDVRAGCANAL